jgi:hypothetical protein
VVDYVPHPDRIEIARYLLSRGLDPDTGTPAFTEPVEGPEAVAAAPPIAFPDGLQPMLVPLDPPPAPDAPLPAADAVVITWTVDELTGLGKVFTPGHSPKNWFPYAHNYDQFAVDIRPGAPSAHSKRLGSYQLVTLGDMRVLCMKSELHLNQDGIQREPGKATLPVKDLFKQIIAETGAQLVITTGTAGSVIDRFRLGDVVVSRAAKFRLHQEFRNQPYNGQTYTSDWQVPTTHLDAAVALMATFSDRLAEPPFAPPTSNFAFPGQPIPPTEPNTPGIKLEQDARDMPEWHPILTTDYFEYGTTTNGLGDEGCAVEMGDAALGLACTELQNPPNWLVIRNMSDPVINGHLPAKQFRLNEQTTWAVGYYTAYGEWTSVMSAFASWGVLAGLASHD